MVKIGFVIASLIFVDALAWASTAAVPGSVPGTGSAKAMNTFDSAPTFETAAAFEAFDANESQPFSDSSVMPFLRRLGGLHVESNLAEFRTKYSAQVKDFVGFPGAPLTGKQIEFRLGSLIEQASKANARFWYLPPQAVEQHGRTTDFDRAAGSLASDRDLRYALQKEFDLDGWISFRVNFFPDHSEIVAELFGLDKGDKEAASLDAHKVTRKGPGSAVPLLATETLVIGAMPTEETLFDGFVRVWARVSATSGHLSAVVWQSSDLVSIDMGYPQLTVGTKLLAGEVRVQRRHPRTGEVLQTVQLPRATLEVIEAQELSALARVTGLSKSILPQASSDTATAKPSLLHMLVWKDSGQKWDGATDGSAAGPEDEGRDSLQVQQGNTGLGFELKNLIERDAAGLDGARSKRRVLKVPGLEHLYVPRTARGESLGTGATSPIDSLEGGTEGYEQMAVPQPRRSEQDPVSQNQGSDHGNALGVAPQVSDALPRGISERSYFDALAEPETWVHHSSVLSVGQSWAILDTRPCPNKPCNRYSGFPSSVVNLVSGSLGYLVTPTAMLDFEGALAFYSGGDVEGFLINLKALSVHPFSNFSGSRFSLLVGPDLSLGNAKTVLYKKTLNHFGVVAGGSYAFGVAGVGKFLTSASLSVFDVLSGQFCYDLKVATESLASLPKEVGLFFELAQPQSRLTQVNLGVSWNFPAAAGHSSGVGLRPIEDNTVAEPQP